MLPTPTLSFMKIQTSVALLTSLKLPVSFHFNDSVESLNRLFLYNLLFLQLHR